MRHKITNNNYQKEKNKSLISVKRFPKFLLYNINIQIAAISLLLKTFIVRIIRNRQDEVLSVGKGKTVRTLIIYFSNYVKRLTISLFKNSSQCGISEEGR